ncbi:NACHT domain-containing protein [Massilia aurea]|jgi:hypothetical protein|uniref:NACHT domain-containing protein n=1 Tax=Massilia aurea TaxID=373040 RepID=UPI0021633725|nr:NACHT domain-containing protein [Massilia aurea]MCS0709194.1 NACHT domain-containing protein [Massilia aurea]
MNTTTIGNDFRDHVLALLRCKFPDARPEGKASWKNADVVFTMMELGKRVTIAVECKKYSRALQTGDLISIVGNYQSALDNNEINLLLIVSNHPVGAASRQFIEKSRTLRFMTLSDLESWLVGLEPYVKALADEFTSDEVHKYYVEGRFQNENDIAYNSVHAWINSKEFGDTGMAVLGGYGIGKSSLAKRIASAQAQKYIKSPANERLPILIPLGQVVHETELAGLFGKHFTSRFSLENYSYKALMQLNYAGRLLIILDGFDEMKHAMTEHDFRANFREFNKLRAQNSKVLLLGRPNAFTSESSDLLIRGLNRVADQDFTDSDFPAWQEKKLAFFTPDEQIRFLNGFLKHRNPALMDEETRSRRISEVTNDLNDEILQRPVQARIVGLLAADPSYSFKKANRYSLYRDFVREVIHRDQEKRARSIIPAADRHKFLRNLAWWAWTRQGVSQGTFSREEVPTALFEGLSDGQAIDWRAKRMEYLVSSLTEEKDSSFLYFAHRSFQEFLVASYINSLTDITDEQISELSFALNEEICNFLIEAGDSNYLKVIYAKFRKQNNIKISFELLQILALSGELNFELSKKPLDSLVPLDVLIIGSAPNKQVFLANVSRLGSIILGADQSTADAAAFILARRAHDSNEVAGKDIAIEILLQAWERMLSNEVASEDEKILINEDRFGNLGAAIKSSSLKLRLSNGDFLNFGITKAYNVLQKRLSEQGLTVTGKNLSVQFVECEKSFLIERMSKNNALRFKDIYAMTGDEFNIASHRKSPVRRKKLAKI